MRNGAKPTNQIRWLNRKQLLLGECGFFSVGRVGVVFVVHKFNEVRLVVVSGRHLR